jgi:hypothetical protein
MSSRKSSQQRVVVHACVEMVNEKKSRHGPARV